MDTLPSVFQSYFVTFGAENGINTRNTNNLIRKIRRNTNFGANSIQSKVADLWNSLDTEIKLSYTTKQFRVKYKLSLFPYEIVD